MEKLTEFQKFQGAIESSRQEDTAKWLPEGPKTALDYIDLILDRNSKLSGVVNYMRRCDEMEVQIEDDFDDLRRAMLHFVDDVERLTEDLRKYLAAIGVLTIDVISKK
jgi:hypothetical protein